MAKKKAKLLPALGWREWVALPDLGVEEIKAKVDTGARTAALHAWHIEPFEKKGEPWVRFEVHPKQRDMSTTVDCEALVIDERFVRNSGGRGQHRYVVETTLKLGGQSWPIELTLTRRDQMGFRMLLGRATIRGRFVVDPARSFLGRPRSKPSGDKDK